MAVPARRSWTCSRLSRPHAETERKLESLTQLTYVSSSLSSFSPSPVGHSNLSFPRSVPRTVPNRTASTSSNPPFHFVPLDSLEISGSGCRLGARDSSGVEYEISACGPGYSECMSQFCFHRNRHMQAGHESPLTILQVTSKSSLSNPWASVCIRDDG